MEQTKPLRLDIGCGANKRKGFVGLDLRPLPGVDIVCDIEEEPIPLEDSSVSKVYMAHVIEHVSPKRFLWVMSEIHRVCRPGASVVIHAPYGVNPLFVQDPTHAKPINENTFKYFDPREPVYLIYQPPPFHIKECTFDPDCCIMIVLRAVKPRAGASRG
jgi:SAM-dependent methyltransferase